MWKRMDYRWKFCILFIPIIALSLIGASLLSYYETNRLIENELSKSMSATTAQAADNINTWLKTQIIEAESVASTVAAKSINDGFAPIDAHNLNRGKALRGKYPDIFVTFSATNRDGVMHVTTQKDNDWVTTVVNVKERDYFKAIMAGGPPQITPPIIAKATGLTTIALSVPIKDDRNAPQGLIGMGITINMIKKITDNLKWGETGYGIMVAKDGTYIEHPNKDFVQQQKITESKDPLVRELGQKMLEGEPGIFRFHADGDTTHKKIAFYQPVPATGWAVATVIDEAELFAPASRVFQTTTVFMLVVLSLITGVIWFAAKRLTQPLDALALHAQTVSEGNLTLQPLTIHSGDEVGRLTLAFNTMTERLRVLVQRISHTTEQVAASAEELTASSEQSSQAANQVAGSIASVANGANGQLIATQETLTVVEQMSAGLQQVAANTNQVAEQSARAAEKASEGMKAAEKAVSQMTGVEGTVNTSAQVIAQLGVRSQEISLIVDTISGIAGQTNLLALNAAIEAARAGEQGRGFAVVAEEIRKLAEQSQEAAKRITEMIRGIQDDTTKAVAAMNEGTLEVKTGAEVVNAAGAAFQIIVELVSQVSNQVRDISASLQQIASGSRQIVGSVQKIDALSKSSAKEAETVSAATEEQLASMEEIASSSEALAKTAQELREQVAKFRI